MESKARQPRRRLPGSAAFTRGRALGGFTLIEILVALFIFSIIVATVFGSYRAIFSKADTIGEGIRLGEMAQSCLNRMAMDLSAVHVSLPSADKPQDLDEEPDPFRFVGTAGGDAGGDFPMLRFASLAHVPLGPVKRDGVAEIVYYVDTVADDRHVLRRSDRLDFTEPFEKSPAHPVVCESVKSIGVQYTDSEGESHDRWDSDQEDFDRATPRAVAVELEVGAAFGSRFYKSRVLLPVYRPAAE